MKSVENWLYDWAMNVVMREGGKQAERQTDRQAAENDEGIYTDNLFNNFMSSKSNKSYKRHNDDGDDDDDDDDGRWKRRQRHRRSKVRLHRRTAPNDAAQVEVEQQEGAEREREMGVVVIAVVGRLFGFVWFRFGFLERRSQSLNRCSIVRLNEERMGVALG